MSRIGLKPIDIPTGVEVKINDNNYIEVKGPKGQIAQQLNTSGKRFCIVTATETL